MSVSCLLVTLSRKNCFLVIGTEDIRQAICGFHNAFPTGIPETHLQPENIIVSDGSKMLIYLVMAVSQGSKLYAHCNSVVLSLSRSVSI